MTDYTKTVNFAAKDALISGNPNKVVQGTEIDTEFNNIATSIATKADTASPTFTGTVTTESLISSVNDASNSSVTAVHTIRHTTSGTAAAGIGVGVDFVAENASGTNRTLLSLDAVTTDVTNASEDADLVVSLIKAGSLTEALRLTSTGGLVMTGGSLTDSTGTISFGDDNLTTTGNVTASQLTGTVQTAAQPNITSVGTLTTLTVDNITINGAVITSDTGAISFGNENLTTTGTAATGALTVSTGSVSGAINSTADDFIVRSAGPGGISIHTPDASNSNLFFASETTDSGATVFWNYDAGNFSFQTNKVGASVLLRADNGVTNLTLSGASGSELATFAGDADVSSGGIYLGGSGAANYLDDYEEGTWTPVISDLTNDATMGATNAGFYTKVGRQVTLTGTVKTTSLGSVSGGIYITGMPFTPMSTSNSTSGGVAVVADGLSITAGYFITLQTFPGSNNIALRLWGGTLGPTLMQGTEWSADGQIGFSITYYTA